MNSGRTILSRHFSLAVCFLAISEAVLVLLSWMASTAFPLMPVRSLISAEGIRWFFGSFTAGIGSAPLAWIILLGMAYGALRRSGAVSVSRRVLAGRRATILEKLAVFVMAAELAVSVVAAVLLTALPQAILLSATGNLFPSSFSSSIVAMAAFCTIVAALSSAVVTKRFTTVAECVESLVYGIRAAAPVVVAYVFAAQLYHSVCYVFIL